MMPLSRKENTGFCVQGDNDLRKDKDTLSLCINRKKEYVDINLKIWLTDFHNRKMNCFSFVNCAESEKRKGAAGTLRIRD